MGVAIVKRATVQFPIIRKCDSIPFIRVKNYQFVTFVVA